MALTLLPYAHTSLENCDPNQKQSLVICFDDFEGYLPRKNTQTPARLHLSKIEGKYITEARDTYIQPLISALLSFTNAIYKNLSFSYFLRAMDVVEYILILFPLAVESFEATSFETLHAVIHADDLDAKVKQEGILDLNRVIARILLIKKSSYISTSHPIWNSILSILQADFKQGKLQDKYCHIILLLNVGESILESTDLSLVALFSKLSVFQSTSNQPTTAESAAVLVSVVDLLHKIMQSIPKNTNMKDLLRENIEMMMVDSSELSPKVGCCSTRTTRSSTLPSLRPTASSKRGR